MTRGPAAPAGDSRLSGAPQVPAAPRLLGGPVCGAALVLSMFTEAVGYGMVAPTLPFMAQHVGADEGRIGFLVGVYALVGMFAAVPLGALGSRYGRRALVILGMACLTSASIGFIFAPNYAWLVAARVVQGLGASGVWVGSLTLAADLSQQESMGSSLSWLTGAWSLGFIAGPALGGIGSLRVPFILYAIMSAAGLVVAAVGLPAIGRGGPRATLAGIMRVFRRRPVLASGAATFGLAFFYGTIEAFLPLLLAGGGATGFAVSASGRAEIGLLFTVAGLPSVILPVIAGRLADRHGDVRLIVGGFLFAATLSAVFLPLYGRMPNLLLFFLLGCVEVVVYVPAVALLHRGVTSADRVFASASHSYAFSGGFFLGPLLTGALFPLGGWRMMFGALVVVVLAAAAVVVAATRGQGAPEPLAGGGPAY